MPLIVADTNILSYMFKNHPLAAAYRPLMEGNRWAISFMSLAELHEGAARAHWGSAAIRRLDEFLQAFTVVHSTDELSTAPQKFLTPCAADADPDRGASEEPIRRRSVTSEQRRAGPAGANNGSGTSAARY